jgi:hypothetical protein
MSSGFFRNVGFWYLLALTSHRCGVLERLNLPAPIYRNKTGGRITSSVSDSISRALHLLEISFHVQVIKPTVKRFEVDMHENLLPFFFCDFEGNCHWFMSCTVNPPCTIPLQISTPMSGPGINADFCCTSRILRIHSPLVYYPITTHHHSFTTLSQLNLTAGPSPRSLESTAEPILV